MKRIKIHPAWLVLIACILFQGATLGIMNNCLGIFYASISRDLGLRMGDLSIITTIMQLCSAFFIPFLVILLTKRKMHLYLLVTTVICTLAFGLMGFYRSLYQFYISGIIMGIFGCVVFVTPVSILINNWFIRQKSLAFGIAFASSGIFGAILNPVCSQIIGSLGWRYAIIIMTLLSLLLSVPAILLFMRRTPQEKGLQPYGHESHAGHTADKNTVPAQPAGDYQHPVLLLGCCMLTKAIFCWFSQYNGHLVNFGQSIGLTLTAASAVTSFAMIGNVLSKIFLGIVGDKKGYQPAMYLGLLFSGMGFLLFSLCIPNSLLLNTGGLLFGSSNALASMLHSMIAAHLYAGNNYEKNYARITSAGYIGSAVAVAAIGYSYDFTGTYQPSLFFAILLCFISAVIGIVIYRLSRQKKERLH